MGTSKRPEVVETEAVPIDQEVATLTEFDRWLAGCEGEVEAEAAGHDPQEIADDAGYEAAKAAHQRVTRLKRRIERERTDRLRPVKEVVRGLEARTRSVVAPLKALDEAYARREAAWEKELGARRRSALEARYAEFAPLLADMVPFERLSGTLDPDGSWGLLKISDEKAAELMEYAVSKVSEGYQTICMQSCSDAEMDELKTEFFLTLDVGEAIRRVAERRRQAEAVGAFEEERAMSQAPDPEPPARPAPAPVAPAPAPAPPAPAPAPQAPVPQAQRGEAARPWTVIIPEATRAQMDQVAAALKAAGVSGNIKPGTVAQVYARLYAAPEDALGVE